MKIIVRKAHKRSNRSKWYHFWRFFHLNQGHHKHRKAVFIDVFIGRFIATIAALLILGYIAAAIALSLYWGRHDHSDITVWDTLLPNRWSHIRPLQGQMLIANADEAMEKAKDDPSYARSAFFLYRSGLAKYPQDHDARLMLARFFITSRMYEEAAEVLADGLDYGVPQNQAYIPALLEIIQLRGNHPLSRKVIPKLLEIETFANNPRAKYPSYRQLMVSQLQGEDYIGLLKTAKKINQDPDSPYKAHDMVVMALARMGSVEEALQYLNDLPAEIQGSPIIILQKASVLKENENKEGMMNELQHLFREYPQAWQIQVNAIMLMLNSKEDKQADAYITLFLNNHARNINAITSLASTLTDRPDSTRMKKLLDFTNDRHPKLVKSMEFLYLQALLTEGNFIDAQKVFDEWNQSLPEGSEAEDYEIVFGQILDAVNIRGQDTRRTLNDTLRSKKWEAEIYWEAARALYTDEQYEAAIQALDIALDEHPFHPSIITLRDKSVEANRSEKSSKMSKDSRSNLYDIGITDKNLEN